MTEGKICGYIQILFLVAGDEVLMHRDFEHAFAP